MSKILVVDELGLARKIIRRALERARHDVTEVVNGFDALELLGSESFDFILTETRMPVLSGFELLERLQVEGDVTPVIVITEDQRAATRKFCIEHGAAQVLHKPIDGTVLNTEINLLNWSRGKQEALPSETAATRRTLAVCS